MNLGQGTHLPLREVLVCTDGRVGLFFTNHKTKRAGTLCRLFFCENSTPAAADRRPLVGNVDATITKIYNTIVDVLIK